MTTAQNGIFTEGHRTHHVLEYTVKAGASTADIKAALSTARTGLNNADLAHAIAFGPSLWGDLAPTAMPDNFAPFQTIDGPKAQAPATQNDIFVWLHGAARDNVLDAALAVDHALRDVAERKLDLPGFTYHDSRDLTGFVDGSANPKTDEDKRAAALVAQGQAGAGGAFVLSQKWVHDLDAFNAHPVAEQERIFGRTKPDSIELEGDAQPNDSHVSRTDLKIDGVAQKMYRRSIPYGATGEHGLYFLAFTCDQSRFVNVLNSMFGLSGDGVSDHLLQFSKATSGSYWFAPSEDDLVSALS